MINLNRLALLALVCAAPTTVQAQVTLPGIFSDNMVLQQNQEVRFWGTAPAGEPVTLETSWNETVETTANDTGRWEAYLTTPKAGTNAYQLSIAGSRDTVVLKNVVAGEVWFCSGQSNMRFQLRRSEGVEQDMARANNPQIRLFSNSKTGWEQSTAEIAAEFSAVGFYFGLSLHQALDVPVGLILAAVGGSPAEAWTPLETLQNDPDLKTVIDRWEQWLTDYEATDSSAYDSLLKKWESSGKKGEEPLMPRSVYSIKRYHHQPGILFRDKVQPFIPYALKGVVWYQGESNMEWPDEYERLFSGLITSWRSAWGQGDLPFYFVQIPPYNYSTRHGVDRSANAPILREAQYRTLKLANTGMAGSMDVGDPTNVHPVVKKPIGERLARIALAQTYGFEDIEYAGPTFKRCSVSDGRVMVDFDHAANGLVARDGPARWFELAGADGVYYPAVAELNGHRAVVSSDLVPEPVKVRYAWKAGAVTNLFNEEGLPAVPFSVDAISEQPT